MPRFDPVQSNFTSGEISPEVLGNFELERYKQALNKCENFVPKKTGGVSRRGGTKYIAEVKDSADDTVLISFNYKDEYQYVLEFGDQYFRVFRNQAYVTEIATNYAESIVKDLRFTQDEENLYITHPDYHPSRISRTSHTSWTIEWLDFDIERGISDVCWSPELGIFVAVTDRQTSGVNSKILTSKDGSYWEPHDSGSYTLWYGVCWSADLSLFVAVGKPWSGSGNIATSPDGKTWTTRTAPEDNYWRSVCWSSSLTLFVAVSSTGSSYQVMTSPDGITWTGRSAASATSWYSVCWNEDDDLFVAVAHNNTTSCVMTSSNGTSWSSQTGIANYWESVCWSPEQGIFVAVGSLSTSNVVMTSSNGTAWTSRTPADASAKYFAVCWSADLALFVAVGTAYASSGLDVVMTSPDGITWTAETPAKQYGWSGICWAKELGIFVAVATTISGVATYYTDMVMISSDGATWLSRFSTGISPKEWGTSNFPSLCWIFEQRLFLASTPNESNKIWGSHSIGYNVFDLGIGLDNEGIAITLKEATKLLWATTSNGILLGAKNGVFKLSSTNTNEALTPTNIRSFRTNRYGTAFVDPVDIDGKTIYIQKDSRKMRVMEYELLSDRFKSTDLLILANHVTEGGISRLAYVDEPDSIIYGIREDGQLIGILYDTEYKLTGCFRHVFGGVGASVTSITISENPTTHEDELWLIIRRTINSSIVQYIEILTPGLTLDDSDWTLATFLDSFMTKTGSGFTSITGLSHLEGEDVTILLDGTDWETDTVSSGAVSCTAADNAVVGLDYTSTLETLPMEGGNPIGSAMGKIKRISKMVVRLFRSYLFLISDLLGNTSEVIYCETTDYSGDTDEFAFYGSHETRGQIKIISSYPVPLHILAIMYQVRTKD